MQEDQSGSEHGPGGEQRPPENAGPQVSTPGGGTTPWKAADDTTAFGNAERGDTVSFGRPEPPAAGEQQGGAGGSGTLPAGQLRPGRLRPAPGRVRAGRRVRPGPVGPPGRRIRAGRSGIRRVRPAGELRPARELRPAGRVRPGRAAYGQPGGYGQPGAYGQPGEPTARPGAYGQPGEQGGAGGYGQPGDYGAAGGYGQPGGYGPGGPGGPGGYGTPAGGYGGWGSPAGGYGEPPPRKRRGLAVLLVVAVLAAAAGAGTAVALNGNSGGSTGVSSNDVPAPASNGNGSTNSNLNASAVAAKVEPGVVDITSTLNYQSETAEGTGMVLNSNGLVLTNNHVINGATSIKATLVTSGKTYTARVLGYDVTDDVALLQLQNASGLKTVSVGNSSQVTLGTPVLAIGNAGGQGGTPTVAPGIINATNRTITAGDQGSGTTETLHGMLQTSAQIQPGDSGGPLANAAGKVIGMDTAASSSGSESSSSSTMGYAVPINTALSIARQIAAGHSSSTIQIGLPGFLGVLVPQSDSSSPQQQAQQQQGQSGGFGGLGEAAAAAAARAASTTPRPTRSPARSHPPARGRSSTTCCAAARRPRPACPPVTSSPPSTARPSPRPAR